MHNYNINQINIIRIIIEYCGRCNDVHGFVDFEMNGIEYNDINDFEIEGFNASNFEDLVEFGNMSSDDEF